MKLFTGLFVNKYEFENAPVLKLKRFFTSTVDYRPDPLEIASLGHLSKLGH